MRSAFVVFGFFWGTWAVAAFDVQRFLRFSDAQLGLLLGATVVGGVVANASGGVLAERLGTRAVIAGALTAWGGLLAMTAATTNRIAFCVFFLLMVAAGGLVDVAMNVAATAALGSSPVKLLRVHALYNLGALLGAATAGLLLNVDVSFRAIWVGVAVAAGAMAVWCRAAELPAGERGEPHTAREGLAALARAGIAILAVVFALGALVEGGIGTWGVLFLRSRLGLAAFAGAAAYVAGQLLAITARLTLGWTAQHLGERRGAQIGLGLAAVGLVIEATATQTAPAAVGLALAAVGSAVYWPLLLAYASRGSDRPGVVVGGLSAAGYAGFLAGPPLVGWVSEASDLRWGLGFLAAAALAGAVTPIRSSRPRSRRANRAAGPASATQP